MGIPTMRHPRTKLEALNMKTISNLRKKINHHGRWIAGAFILTVTIGAWAGIDQLMPKMSSGMPGGQSRLGWYLSSGQWHADARTVAAVAHYVFSPDNQDPSTTESATNSQVAETSPQPLPSAGATRATAGNPS